MEKSRLLAVLFLLLTGIGFSQQLSYSGYIYDATDNTPLIAADVKLYKMPGAKTPIVRITDKYGAFSFSSLAPGVYYLNVSYIGYRDYTDTIRLLKKSLENQKLLMKNKSVKLNEVEVTAKAIPAEQKGDTIQFNANAFKTNPDATAEDLVTKVPGVQNDNGTIKAQGETVSQVFVDGKQFFGDDPSIALKNLPADVVDKIQVYDRMSDQSAFTGFDDGNTSKAINIVTKSNRRNGKFGKLYGGLGSDDRFAAGGNLNIFNGDQRLTLLGLGNNINRQNFSPQDILGTSDASSPMRGGMFAMGAGGPGGGGGGGRRGGGSGGGGADISNFMVSNQSGITKTYSTGLNYLDTWNKDLQITGSYFFNYANNENNQSLHRDYYTQSSLNQFYNEQSTSGSNNYNHRVNLRLEYTMDTLNSILFTPKVSFQTNHANSQVLGENFLDDAQVSSANYLNKSNTHGNNFSGDLLLRHKFEAPGRTLQIDFNGGSNARKGDGTKLSYNKYFTTITGVDTSVTDQINSQSVNGASMGVTLNYTEPLSTMSILQFTGNTSYNRDISNKNSYDLDTLNNLYDIIDPIQTNDYESRYYYSRGGVSYRLRGEKSNFTAEAMYQKSHMQGNQTIPTSFSVDKTFESWLPSLRYQYRVSRTNNIRFEYSTSINPPSISQLQNTIDNTNPLLLKTGNPNLSEEFSHRIRFNYLHTNLDNGSMIFGMLFLTYTKHPISNFTYTALKDTALSPTITLNRGSQLTYPINLDHSLSARSFINYGYMWNDIRCNFNFFFSPGYTISPGLVNGVQNISRTLSSAQGITISSNVSEDVDFRLTYNPSINRTRNDVAKSLDNVYTIQNASANCNVFIFSNWYVKSDFTYYYNNYSQSSSDNQKYYLWNAGTGIKFLSDKSADLKFEVFDILNQNKSITRSVTETYLEDKTSLVLKRYFLVTFTYTIKAFRGM